MTPISSTLNFSYSLRQSADPVKGIVLCKKSGNYITYDDSAIRLWSSKSQVKSLRLKIDDTLVFHCMEYLLEINSIVVIFSAKRNSVDKGGAIFIVDEYLTLLQEITLKHRMIRKVSISPEQKHIAILDSENLITISRLDNSGKRNEGPKKGKKRGRTSKFMTYDDEDSSSSDEDAPRKKGGKEMYNPVKASVKYLKLVETQTIQLDSGNPKDIIIVNTKTMAVLDDISIHVYSRESGTVIDKVLKKVENTEEVPFILLSLVTIKLGMFNPFKQPKLIRTVNGSTFIVGFNDGSFQILSIAALMVSEDTPSLNILQSIEADSKSKNSATVLCEFQAHSTRNNTFRSNSNDGILDASLAPWKCLQSGNVYTAEFFTVGDDKRLVHWGLRMEDLTEEEAIAAEPLIADNLAPAYKFKADLLGEFQLKYEPPSHISTKFKNDIVAPMKSHFIAFELACLDSPIRKKVVCSNGGMLLILDIMQPHRALGKEMTKDLKAVNSKSKLAINDISTTDLNAIILSACRGPTLLSAQDTENILDESDISCESTVLLLKMDVIEIVSLASGAVVQQFSTLNLRDYVYSTQQVSRNDKNISFDYVQDKAVSSHLPNGIALKEELNELEGQPSVAHWCNLSRLVVIGYSLGGVGIIGLTGVINSDLKKPPYSYLKTNKIHGSEITLLTTFNHSLTVKGVEKPIIACLVGDSNGVISLWQIYPASTNHSPILSSSQRHPGKMLFAHTCLLEPNVSKRILVTACSAGTVKAWKVQEDGELSLMASFRSEKAKLTSVSVAPIITREKVVAADDLIDDDAISFSSQTTMTKQSSIQSAPSESKGDSSAQKPTLRTEYEIHCVCGFSNGLIENWLISSNKRHSYNSPVQVYQENKVSVSKIIRVPQPSDNYVNTQNFNESIFCPFEDVDLSFNQGYFLVSFSDGSHSSLILSKNGTLRRRNYFVMPSKINFIVSGYNTMPFEDSKYNLECLLISDLGVHEVLVNCADSSFVSEKWQHATKTPLLAAKSGNVPTEQDEQVMMMYERQRNPTQMADSEHFDQGEEESKVTENRNADLQEDNDKDSSQSEDASDSTRTTPISRKSSDSEIEIKEVSPRASNAVGYSNTQSPAAATAAISMSKSSNESLSNSKEYVGNMESSQRIISTELHFAKKDRKLLDLFLKNDLGANGSVSAADAVEIVFSWLNSVKVARESIWELLKLLEIKDNDQLKFIEVAKIAAVVSSALNKTLQELGEKMDGKKSKRTRFKNYQTLKSYTTKVSYNSMGEKVVERVPLQKETMGIYNGFVTTIRRIWNEENCRVITQSESRSLLVKPLDIRLQQVPAEFKSIFSGQKLDLPMSWLPAKNAHWFDPLRVIRIARTLLDMRSSLQHETVPIGIDRKDIHFSNHKNQVLRMEAILVKYFERNYGNKDLHVTPLKVVNFLEACLQYQHHPIVNIIQGMLRIEPDTINLPPVLFETAIWICTEARSALCARGSVIEGAFMQPYNSDFNYIESFVKDGAVWQVRWQLVRRADAISITDELLRLRGGYGPAMYLQIFGAIESIPWIRNDSYSSGIADGPIGSVNPGLNDQLIDLECFLEVLFYEYLRYESLAYDSEQNVFGEGAMALAVNVERRDINNASTAKRKFIIDDQDFQYGFFHDSNMAKIKLLMLEFIRFDPLRTGILDQITFEKVLRESGMPLFTKGGDDGGIAEVQVRAFLRVVHKMFLEGSPAAPVSYIDLCAALLGWEFQCQGDREVTLAILTKDISEMKRSIEQAYANELVRFFSSVQLLDNIAFYSIADPIWVMLPVTRPSVQTEDSKRSTFALPTNGDWVVNTSAPDDISANPFFTDALTFSMKGLALGKPAVVAEKMNRSNKIDVHIKDAVPHPKVLSTNRFLRTIHGEIIESGYSSKPVEKCPIAKTIISLDIPMFDPLQPTAKEVALELSRQSFSRGVSDIVDKSSFISDGVTYTHRDNQLPSDGKSTSLLEARPQQSLLSDGSIVVQLRSLLPATYSPPKSADIKGAQLHPQGSIKNNELTTSEQLEVYSAAQSPLRSVGTPHRLSRNAKSSLFSFSTSTDRPSQSLAEIVDPVLYSNSILESLSDINYGILNDNKELLNQSKIGDQNIDGGLFLSRPNTRGHNSSAVFLSGEGGVGVSAFYGGSISTEDSMVQSLAKEEAQNRLTSLKGRDEEFEKIFQKEREEFEKRENEKHILQKQIRRELRMKERESMKVYYEAIEDKYRIAMKGKAQLDAALALEEEDKKQREREIQAILERNKERSLQLQEQKFALKKAEEEMSRQIAEYTIMAKEDKLSALVRKELAMAARAENERAAKLLAQEMEERMREASLLQSTAESEMLHQESAVDHLNSASLLSDSFFKSAEESVDRKSVSPVPSRVPSPELVQSADQDDGADVAEDEGDAFDDEDEADEVDEEEAEAVGSASPRSVAEEDVVERVVNSVQSSHSMEGIADQAVDVVKTEAEKRLDAFIEKLESSFHTNSHHPRRKEKDNVFFIPLNFSGDISFNPFATDAHYDPKNTVDIRNAVHPGEAVQHVSIISTASSAVNPAAFPAYIETQEDGGESSKIDPFADIKRAVKGYRKELEKQRNLLYSLDDMTAADFLRIYRRGVVKWNDFFLQEKRKERALRQQENDQDDVAVLTDDEDDPLPVPVPAMVVNDDDSIDSSLASTDKRKDLNKSLAIPSSFNEIPDIRTAVITPLPAAKVLKKQRLHTSEYKFYQIENVDKNGILTVEVQCKKGSADIYLSRGYLPTSSIFEFEAHSKAESNITRLTADVPLPGTYMLSIHAPSGQCKYSIWCCITKENVVQERPAITHVNELLIKFDILSQHDPKVLEIHFPRLYQEAGEISEKETAIFLETANHRRSVITEMKQLASENSSFVQSLKLGVNNDNDDDEDEDAIESDNIDRFVTKVGRHAMKKERELIKKARKSRGRIHVDYLFNIRDPNLHRDLFNEAQLHALNDDLVFEGNVEPDKEEQPDDWDGDLSDGDSGSNGQKTLVAGPDNAFLNVFNSVQKTGRREHTDLISRNRVSSSSSYVMSVASSDHSEPMLKLPPINTATTTNDATRSSFSRRSQPSSPKQKQMLKSYSHLAFDMGPSGDNLFGTEPKKKLRKSVKDPLLKKVSGPISYKLSKF